MKYSIEGEPFPVVICEMEQGESMICEAGGMSWMSPNMKMETSSRGGLGKMIGRAMTNEHMFMNSYTAQGGSGLIAFASNFPGTIRKLEISPGNEIVVQKSGYLCSTENVELSIFFQRKLGAGLVGGDGFIMQKLSGNGLAFVELDGYIKEYDLNAGQEIIVNTGYLAMMSATCTMEVETVSGVKNVFLGGEGMFNTVVKGPGKVWIQSLPINMIAKDLIPYLPASK